MLDKIKILLGITDDSKDEVLSIFINMAKNYATVYCNLYDYDSKLDSIVIEMVIERYNKVGTEGVYKVTSSGVNETYISGYSPIIMRQLMKYRKVKCV